MRVRVISRRFILFFLFSLCTLCQFLGIAFLYLLLFVGFLLGYLFRFLLPSGFCFGVPRLGDFPLGTELQLLWIIIDRLWLQPLVIFASVPNAVAVVVVEKTQVIGLRIDEIEVGFPLWGTGGFDDFVLAVEQFHHSRCVSILQGDKQGAEGVESFYPNDTVCRFGGFAVDADKRW